MTLTTDEKVEITNNLLIQTKNILNQNHKLVQFENLKYTPSITINISFLFNDKNEIDNSIYDEVKQIITNQGFRNDDKITIKYYFHLIKNVCKGGNRRICLNNDIDNLFRYDFVREFYSLREYINKYIIFTNDKFVLIDNYENKVKEFYNNKLNNKK